MKIYRLDHMTRGWFVGAFEPTVCHTPDFEVGYREYEPGVHDMHYHTQVTEINLVVKGSLRLQNRILVAGDIFVLEPWEITDPEFLEVSGIVCVKMPSVNDKQCVQHVTE